MSLKDNVKTFMENEDTSPIHFGVWNFFHKPVTKNDLDRLDTKVKRLKSLHNIKDRLIEIITIGYDGYPIGTFLENGEIQCQPFCRRSVLDIWRIYNYYFPKVSIFRIMYLLYEIVTDDDNDSVSTNVCSDIERQVFWVRDFDDAYVVMDEDKNEFGYYMEAWKSLSEEN